jgi:hypothetical protein
MIRYDMEQYSPEWWAVRLGLPTASCFDKIVTPAKGELSKSARAYAQYLVAETLFGEPLEPERPDPYWIAWGKLHEPMAAEHYDLTTGTVTEKVGFITTDDGRVGCSPDRMIIGQRGCVEIKCPAPQTHVGYLIDGPGLDYKCQLQGQMAVGELAFVDFFSFHPRMPPALHRIERDEPYIAKMSEALRQFLAIRDEMLAKALESGWRMTESDVPATWAAVKALAA